MAEGPHAGERRQTALSLLATLLLAAFTTQPAAAWGPKGHRVVGQIAENHLSAPALAAVRELMGSESLARAGTWADEIRSDPAWEHAAPWHFISVDDDETLETTERSSQGDVLSAMERYEGVLRNPEAPREERVVALRFLVHFVADVHQPLHVGRRADGGGNDTLVLWFGEPTHLHALWDTHLVEHQGLSFTELVRFIDHPSPAEVAAWQGSSYEDWIAESFGLRDRVYDLGDRRLGYDYAKENVPVVERRLLQAGVRLAGLLDDLLIPTASRP